MKNKIFNIFNKNIKHFIIFISVIKNILFSLVSYGVAKNIIILICI